MVNTVGIINLVAGGSTGTSNNIPATTAHFTGIRGITGDTMGNLYLATYGDYYLYQVNTVTGIVSQFAGNGVSSASLTNNVAATSTSITTSYGLSVDTSGNIYYPSTSGNYVALISNVMSTPTSQPTRQPTRQPTSQPSRRPSSKPSRQPTCQPSQQPALPSSQPSRQPSRQPTSQPSMQPTSQPSCQPSEQPASHPTARPTAIAYVTAPSVKVPRLQWSAIAMSHGGLRHMKKYATALQVDGGIYISSSPLALTWTLSEARAISWKSVAISYTGQYQLAGSTSGLCGQSDDYGVSWNISASICSAPEAAIRFVSMVGSGQYRFASSYADHALDTNNFTLSAETAVYLSTNYGQVWHQLQLNSSNNSSDLFAAAMNGNASVMIVAAYDSIADGVYYSHDHGESWHQAGVSASLLLAASAHWIYATVSYEGRYAALLQSSGKVAYSSNYGQSWQALSSGTSQLLPRIADSISISANGQYWLIIHANETAFYLSRDYASTWQEIETPAEAGGVSKAAMEVGDGSLALLLPKDVGRIYVYSIQAKTFIRPGMNLTTDNVAEATCACQAT